MNSSATRAQPARLFPLFPALLCGLGALALGAPRASAMDHDDGPVGNGGGIEWELPMTGITGVSGVISADSKASTSTASAVAPGDGDILCTKATGEGDIRLLKVTKDLEWTNYAPGKHSKNISTIELVSAPIRRDDNTKLEAALAAATNFYKAVLADCTMVAGFDGKGSEHLPHACLAKGSAVLATLGETWEWCSNGGTSQNKTDLTMLINLPGTTKEYSVALFDVQNTQVNAEVSLAAVAGGKLTRYFGTANLVKDAYVHFSGTHNFGGISASKKGLLILRAYGLVADILTQADKMKKDTDGVHWVLADNAQGGSGVSRKNLFDVYLKTKFDNASLKDVPTPEQVTAVLAAACSWFRTKKTYPWLGEDCKVNYHVKLDHEFHAATEDLVEEWKGANPIKPKKPLSPIHGDNRVVVEVRLKTDLTKSASLKWATAGSGKFGFVDKAKYQSEMQAGE